jgi:hypothetical protein
MPTRPIAVCLEIAPKKAFASALVWPGWCRSGRDEEAALEALASYASRYAPVAQRADVRFPANAPLEVVERLQGSATTEFGVPDKTAAAETEPVTPAAARQMAGLVTAAWAEFDEIASAAPAELLKGPRGGGRNRDKMIDHVLESEAAYARKIGVKLKPPAIDDITAIEELREAIAAVLAERSDGSPPVPGGWTTRYAARRIAWHVLDHAWEMQDKIPT